MFLPYPTSPDWTCIICNSSSGIEPLIGFSANLILPPCKDHNVIPWSYVYVWRTKLLAMKTQLSKSYLRKCATLFFMLLLIVSMLFAKHLHAQTTLWVENAKTNQRVYISVNQKISYKLRSSTNFHKGRIVSFTDSTLTMIIKVRKPVTLRFIDLKEITIPSDGRKVGGALLTAIGAVSLIAGVSAVSSASSATRQIVTSGTDGIVIGLVLLPIGLILLKGKTVNLEKSWTLRTN